MAKLLRKFPCENMEQAKAFWREYRVGGPFRAILEDTFGVYNVPLHYTWDKSGKMFYIYSSRGQEDETIKPKDWSISWFDGEALDKWWETWGEEHQ